jgi:hypothetical protein
MPFSIWRLNPWSLFKASSKDIIALLPVLFSGSHEIESDPRPDIEMFMPGVPFLVNVMMSPGLEMA